MSIPAQNWCLRLMIPPGPKYVLLILSNRGNNHRDGESWTCFPSVDQLLEDTCLPLRTLERHLGWLRSAGLIDVFADRTPRGRLETRHYELQADWTVRSLAPDLLADWPPHLAKYLPDDLRAGSPPANMAGGEDERLSDHEAAQPHAGIPEENQPVSEPSHELPPEPGAPSRLSEHPPANMAGGADGGASTRQNVGVHPPNVGSPPANMAGGYIEEPKGTQKEPKARGGARDGGEGPGLGFWETFDAVHRAIPSAMHPTTKLKAARSAWSKVTRKTKPEAILAAAKRYAADPDVMARRFLPGLDVWLEQQTFRRWLPSDEETIAQAVAEASAPILAGAPEDVMDIVGARGSAWARSWLTEAQWIEAERLIVTKLGVQADRVRDAIGRELAELRIRVKSRAEMSAEVGA